MAKKKKRRVPAKALDLFVNALSFKAASAALNQFLSLNQNSKELLLFWPMVVNEAFALELSLKALHRVRRRTLMGHDVETLFGRLSKADKRQIRIYFDGIVKKHHLYEAFVNEGVSFDIDSVLLRAKDTFVRIRYWHEQSQPSRDHSGHASNAGCGSLIDSVITVILDSRPEWNTLQIHIPGLWNSTQQTTLPCR